MARASKTQKTTRIQREKRETILAAALDVFAMHGFRGTTIDMIAKAAGLSKPNLLYYFDGKEAMHTILLERILATWLGPLENLNADCDDPITEIWTYVRQKLAISRDHPRESRLFANEILRGAPALQDYLHNDLRTLVEQEVAVLQNWMDEGRIAARDPYHLLFTIWSTTQHYSDFDVQVQAVLGPERANTRFQDAETYLHGMMLALLTPPQK